MEYNNPQQAIAHFKKHVLPTLTFESEQEKKQTMAYANRPMGDWSPNKINQFLEKYPEHCQITWQYNFSEKVEQNEEAKEK
ncbi:hypothetical protein [uncultured Microscilla sp.]|uniref:hypothetical protein n=1 Tax=uncultured Microscilla sp. TaxID=432653 RepID=UPI00262C1046|nr:hypothetical protein [uncultured Microscilla sp.]